MSPTPPTRGKNLNVHDEIEMAPFAEGNSQEDGDIAEAEAMKEQQASLLTTSRTPPEKKEQALLLLTPVLTPFDSSLEDERIRTLNHARRLLYLLYLFAEFSDISWRFSLTFFLAAIANYQSLFWVASYGLTAQSAVMLLGSTTGDLVDRTNRLLAAQCFIVTEKICVVMATIICFILLSREVNKNTTTDEDESKTTADTYSLFLILGIHILGAAGRVINQAFHVAIERDWVVVMSQFVPAGGASNTSTSASLWLSDTNVAVRQIHLICKIATPVVAGFLIALVDNRTNISTTTTTTTSHAGSQFPLAALVVGAINALALVVEYKCTAWIYQAIPDLAILQPQENKSQEGAQLDDDEEEDYLKPIPTLTPTSQGRFCTKFLPPGLRIYFQQTTSFAGIGLALLYLNVLCFGDLFIAYLEFRGMGLETIGVLRGIASSIGLLGTCIYHLSIRRTSVESTGLWSIVYDFLCLTLSYASLFVHDKRTSLAMLIAGVCASRIGLWVFDIAVTQMMQESIPDGVRGVVGGVQLSLNSFCELLSYLLGIIFPDPADFCIYVAAGYASVGLAMLLFAIGTYARKG